MIKAIAITFLLLASMPSYAGPYTETAKTCIADTTNGKDRKALARWIFLGISVHPEIRSLVAVPEDVREQANKTTGELFTRLVTQSCANEFQLASKNEGAAAIKEAFEFLGIIAMQELMSNSDVTLAFTGLEKYIDREKISSVLNK